MVWLKNIGDGKAFEPTVLLKNESGSKVFLKNGRVQAKELLPGEEIPMKFAFRVKEPTDTAKFEIQIFDSKMHDLWRDKITIDTSRKLTSKSHVRSLSLKGKKADLLERPTPQGKVIATLNAGLHLESLREVNDYFLVKVDNNLSGFVKKSDVLELPSMKKPPMQKKGQYYTIKYDRVPAQVVLKFGDGDGLVTKDSGTVTADIHNLGSLSSVLLYVNSKKVLYKDVARSMGKQNFKQLVHLKPGVNVITLFASEDTTYGQRESITVFYDDDGKASNLLRFLLRTLTVEWETFGRLHSRASPS